VLCIRKLKPQSSVLSRVELQSVSRNGLSNPGRVCRLQESFFAQSAVYAVIFCVVLMQKGLLESLMGKHRILAGALWNGPYGLDFPYIEFTMESGKL